MVRIQARTILVTGASSGIGKALALHYAGEGIGLALMGRDARRLELVVDDCRRRGSTVHPALIDVRDRAAMARWLIEFDRVNPVDLLVANAGVMAGTPPGGEVERPDAAYAAVETNLLGVLNTIQPLLPLMMQRRHGQIALIGSLAGFVPLPDCPSYSASKAAVLSYGQSLRALLAPYGIGVSVACPGYVTTPMMLRESGRKPFAMSAERAAALIAAGLRRNRAVISFPFLLSIGSRLHGLMPDRIRRRLSDNSRFTVSD